MRGKSIVMGAAVGYGWMEVRNFVVTLRNTGYDGDICLFMDNNIALSDRVEFAKYNVTIRIVNKYLNLLPDFIGKKRFTRFLNPVHSIIIFISRLLPLTYSRKTYLRGRYSSFFLSAACSRYFYYYDFIKNKEYQSVLLADVKDVVFQSNPFLSFSKGLQVAIENTDLTIATEPCNERWVKIIYGDSVLSEIGNASISCSGTTMGDYSSVIHYLLKMIDETAKHITKIAGAYGFDQGIHNFLLQNSAFVDVRRNMNNRGFFLTMLSQPEHTFNQVNGYLYNDDGQLISIIHQYNWFPQVKLRVIEGLYAMEE